MITIKEIAAEAGVSLGTVDRVLHNRGRVSQETIALVRRIAEENGYVTNQLGRRLRKNQQFRFGVLLPDLGSAKHAFWNQIINGVEEARKELESLQIEIIYSTFDTMADESFLNAGKKLLSNGVDAYIVAPIVAEGMRSLVKLFPDIPFAFVDSSLPDIKPMWNFAQDPIAAGKTGARLMSMMYPAFARVAALPIPKTISNSTETRADSFCASYSEEHPNVPIRKFYGIEIEEVIDDLIDFSSGEGITGIFVVSAQAASLCRILEERGIYDRFRIIGFDLSDENREVLRNGKIGAIIGQRPQAQGHDAITTIYNHFVLQHDAEKILSAPIDIYIKENIPESSHWL